MQGTMSKFNQAQVRPIAKDFGSSDLSMVPTARILMFRSTSSLKRQEKLA
jgi:hypothetical protein